MRAINDFKVAPLKIKLLLIGMLAYLFIFIPMIFAGYMGKGLQEGLLLFFGVGKNCH